LAGFVTEAYRFTSQIPPTAAVPGRAAEVMLYAITLVFVRLAGTVIAVCVPVLYDVNRLPVRVVDTYV
jgi:hypothetical protein